jgi:hypothetical protein
MRGSSNTPLLDRRGGSRPTEASVWRRGGGPSSFASLRESSFASLRMTASLTEGNPPPRLAKFASLICLGTPPVQEGCLLAVLFPLLVQITKHAFFAGEPIKRRGGGPRSLASLRMTVMETKKH